MPSSPWIFITFRPVLKCQYLGALELGTLRLASGVQRRLSRFQVAIPLAVAPLSLTTRTLKVVSQDEYGTRGIRHHCLKARRRKIDPGSTKNCVPEQLQLGTYSLPSLPLSFFGACTKICSSFNNPEAIRGAFSPVSTRISIKFPYHIYKFICLITRLLLIRCSQRYLSIHIIYISYP